MIIKVRDKDNLELRTLVPDNADEIFGVINVNREHLRQWLPWVDGVESPDNTRETICKWQQELNDKENYTFGIFYSGNYIGNIGLHDTKSKNNSAMIGYWLAEDYQGKGIVTDCVRVLTDFGFDELGLNRIWIACAFGNKKSRAIPERLGYVQEGIFQDKIYMYGEYHDQVIYGMVKRKRVK